MNKKAIILFVVLILPVFIYLGLKTWGTNHFVLPRYIPAIDSTTGEIKMGKRLNPRWNESELDTIFQTIPAFNLINEKGQKFSSSSLKGKIYVASFFFTRCGTICPKITGQLSRVQDTFNKDPDLKLISISVDPAFDHPEKLQAYAKRFDANEGQWTFLTGEKKSNLSAYFNRISCSPSRCLRI